MPAGPPATRCRHRLWLGCCASCSAVAYLVELGAQIRRNATRRLVVRLGRSQEVRP